MSHNGNCQVLKRPLKQCGRGLNNGNLSCSLLCTVLEATPSTWEKHIQVTVQSTHLKGCVSFQLLYVPTQSKAATDSSPPQWRMHSQGPACAPLPALASLPPMAGDRPQWQLSALQCITDMHSPDTQRPDLFLLIAIFSRNLLKLQLKVLLKWIFMPKWEMGEKI